MTLWRDLTEKSWLDQTLPTTDYGTFTQRDFLSKRIALWLFIAMVTVIFSLFIVTFLTHSQYPDFAALAGAPWRPLGDTSQLWISTGLLVASSVLMQLALTMTKAQRPGYSLAFLIAAGLMALQFLLSQAVLWQQLSGMGYGIRSNPASSYFFLFTGIHGLHLLGGVAVLIRPLSLMWRSSTTERITGSLRLCALYWHYLLGIWLLLFLFLTRSPETYQWLAALCGLEA